MNHLSEFKALFRSALASWLCCAALVAGLVAGTFRAQAATPASEHPVTIEAVDRPLDDVFSDIRKQTGMSVVYSTSEIDPARRVTLSLHNVPLTTALDALFRGTDIKYMFKEGHIVLVRKPAVARSVAAPVGVRGTVKDAAGLPLIGATVIIKGTTVGAAAGVDGGFDLPQAKPGDQLEVSLIGYVKQTIPVTTGTIDVVMHEDSKELDAVVVTALGIKKEEKALTYNVQEVSGNIANKVKDASFVNTLTGKIAGIQINNSASGIGGSTRVIMRGTKSLFGNNNALYVVDGTPLPNLTNDQTTSIYETPDGGDGDGISNLNPEDIASMSVLTGAAAAALYGSQGANGVILITTKKGEEGHVRVNYSNSTTFLSPFVTPRFQNTYGSRRGSYMSWGSKLDTPSSYDPMDFFQTGFNETNSLSVSGGTKRNQTYGSASAVNARGIVPNNVYNRYNFTIRNTAELVEDKLTLDQSAQYMRQYDRNMLVQGQFHNPLIPIYLFPRSEDVEKYKLFERYDPVAEYYKQFWPAEYGDLQMGAENPWWIVNRELFENNRDRYMISASMQWKITDCLTLSGRIRDDINQNTYTRKIYASSDTKYASKYGNYLNRKRTDKNLYADAMLNFDKRFGRFDINVTLGASLADAKNDLTSYEGHLVRVPNLFTLSNIDKSDTHTHGVQSRYHDQTQAVFATAQVGYNGMLYLDLSARNDWASQLAFTPKLNIFYPSVGLSAVISSMTDLSKAGISFLKLRASYSEVGNAPQRYITSESYTINDGILNTQGFYPANTLKPELTKAFEVGLNVKFLVNRLNLDVTYYNSNTYNQIFTLDAAASTSYKQFYLNSGKVNNWGIEATLGYKDTFGPVYWESTVTYSMNRNKIKELIGEGSVDPLTGEPLRMESLVVSEIGGYRMELTEGGSMGDIYVTGLTRDYNGEILSDDTGAVSADNGTWYYAGSVDPKHRIGWNNTIDYKGFSLNFLFDYRIGGVVASSTQAIMDRYGVSENSARDRDNGGALLNGGRTDAKDYYDVLGGGKTGLLAYYTYSATNLRLREASIGYTLPSKWFRNKLNMTVSLVGRNLWMLYNRAPFDPELTASTSTYYQGLDYFMQPSMRTVGFSVRLQF